MTSLEAEASRMNERQKWTAAADRARLLAEIGLRHGVARVGALTGAGISRHRIAGAVADGVLVRLRRDWVGLPDADADLVGAARFGVIATCVTQARRLGLWVLSADRPHVAVSPQSTGSKPPGLHVHWARPLVPRHPDALYDPIENVLGYVAACQPHDAALAVFESALSRQLVSADAMRRLPLTSRALALVDEASVFSDSGLETIFLTRLRWLRVRILAQIWIEGHRVDFLLGDRLVVQIDGAHHVGAQRTSDIAHDAALTLLGYRVLRLSYEQIIGDWPAVQDLIMRAVAQGVHRAS